MAYSVNHPLADLPAEVRTRVRRNREEIGRTIESFPVGGVMLESVSQAGGSSSRSKLEQRIRRLLRDRCKP